MPELGTSGSVGALGGQPPGATRRTNATTIRSGTDMVAEGFCKIRDSSGNGPKSRPDSVTNATTIRPGTGKVSV
jgi:hypothetical protein